MSKKVPVRKIASGQPSVQEALKAAGVIVGVGLAAGVSLVLVLDKVKKDIFVNEDWPDEEWSSDDWADEDLD